MLLMHLSDIHFRFDEVNSTMDPNHHLRNEILRDAEAMCKSLGQVPEAILISGDVAYYAKSEEYIFAQKWLDELATRCGVNPTDIFVVPGNHDVDWGITNSKIIDSLHKTLKNEKPLQLDGSVRGYLNDPAVNVLLYKSIENFNAFAGKFLCNLSPPDATRAVRHLSFDDGSILKLTGLNSAFLSGSGDAEGSLVIDPSYYQVVRTAGVINLVLSHHPPKWCKNQKQLQNHLNDVAQIQLFGHEHDARIEQFQNHVKIFAGALHPHRAEEGWEPGYNFIDLNITNAGAVRQLNVKIYVRVWQLSPGRFIAKMNDDLIYFNQVISLENWSAPTGLEAEHNDHLNDASEAESPLEDLAGEDDPMDSLRNIFYNFFQLTLSQKSAIAGKLGLLEESDSKLPDIERFKLAFIRAKERGLIEQLDKEISLVIKK